MQTLSISPLRLPQFTTIQPKQIEPLIRQILLEQKTTLDALLSTNISYHWENLMQPLEDMHELLNEQWSPINHLYAVMETEALRQVYHQVLPLITDHYTELAQNEHLYAAISTLTNPTQFNNLEAAQKKIIENDLRDFKLSGVHLNVQDKGKMLTLQKRLTELTTIFADHVLDATHAFHLHVTDEQHMVGLPDQAKTLAREQAVQKNLAGYIFTLDYPSYSTAMKYLQDRTLRQTLYEAYMTRASDCGPKAKQWDNTDVMEEIIKIRHSIALLVGFDNYASYSLATKMAHSPNEVLDFLKDLLAKSKPLAEKEYLELKQFAVIEDGLTTLEPWDIAYYSEKLQKKLFDFSQEDLRPYFPISNVMQGMFTIINKLFGITITEQEVDVWHPDVKFFVIYDQENTLRGGFYTDLYARSHKRDGAWMDECRTRRQLKSVQIQAPIAYLTCNFMRPVGDQPGLLTFDDVLTLFHEFGHCLHHLLTKVNYPSVAGIKGVAWDAVEFPSQFLENFCWEKSSLNLLAKHVETGQALPDHLYQKMIQAKNFQAGLQMIRQLEFSLFDFNLHLHYDPNKDKQVQSILNEVRQQTAVIPVWSHNRFQHSFSHIFAGSYAAGYYSYKWAEVLSADAYSKFEEDGIFNHDTGMLFLHSILEVGGVPDPMDAFVRFRGRKPTIDALLRHSGIVS